MRVTQRRAGPGASQQRSSSVLTHTARSLSPHVPSRLLACLSRRATLYLITEPVRPVFDVLEELKLGGKARCVGLFLKTHRSRALTLRSPLARPPWIRTAAAIAAPERSTSVHNKSLPQRGVPRLGPEPDRSGCLVPQQGRQDGASPRAPPACARAKPPYCHRISQRPFARQRHLYLCVSSVLRAEVLCDGSAMHRCTGA